MNTVGHSCRRFLVAVEKRLNLIGTFKWVDNLRISLQKPIDEIEGFGAE